MADKGFVFVVGTFDTKAVELHYVAELILAAGAQPLTVDVSTQAHDAHCDVSAHEVARHHPTRPDFLGSVRDRGEAVGLMSEALGAFLPARRDLAAVIGLGGSGNTSLVTAGMRALPVGTPKLMVSTIASGDVGPIVGPNDITMMYSVTDVAGINRISRRVLGNAAHAVAGMVVNTVPPGGEGKPPLAMTMFGVTTPCINALRSRLDTEFDPLVFHATGTGGQSMEKLIDSGMVVHVMDITTTEVGDHLVGGVLSAGEDRFGAIIRRGVPYVGSVGALDMVNFWAKETVPDKYKSRTLYEHNAVVTLMRTTPQENAEMGTWIGKKLNQMKGPVRFLLPEKGLSQIDAVGQPFYDPEADGALFHALESTVEVNDQRKLIRVPAHINDIEFVDALIAAFREIHGP